MKIKNVTKSVSESYKLKFENGMDYAKFTIDESGSFSCQSSFGNFAYTWHSFGDNFKEFLSKLDEGYLFVKLCSRNYFDFQQYVEDCKKEVLRNRKSNIYNEEEARKLWEFFDSYLPKMGEDLSIVRNEFFLSNNLLEPLGDEPWISEFFPETDYSPNQKAFVRNVYPAFAKVLKNELNSSAEVAINETI